MEVNRRWGPTANAPPLGRWNRDSIAISEDQVRASLQCKIFWAGMGQNCRRPTASGSPRWADKLGVDGGRL